MCIYICTECKTVAGSKARQWMPEHIREGGVGEQIVWLATQPIDSLDLICTNEKCSNK